MRNFQFALRQLDRRGFLRAAAAATGALVAACASDSTKRASDTRTTSDTSPDTSDVTTETGTETAATNETTAETTPIDWDTRGGLPSLGGAPDTAEGRAIAAFCDAVIPGQHRDPTGAPGALDANAPAIFFDPRLPAASLVAALQTFLDALASADPSATSGATFYDLTPPQREAALTQGIATLPELEFAIELAKVAFLSSPEAGVWLGYPGANTGYIDDPQFSFKRALTTDLPGTLANGNLP